MATKQTPDIDLDDILPGEGAASAAPAPRVVRDETVAEVVQTGYQGWDGAWTALTLARFIIRDGEGRRSGERVEFQASRDAAGIWRGPEAEHVVDLMRLGVFVGPAAAARSRRQAVIDEERGIHDEPELVDPDDPSKGYKGGAKGLAERTDDEIAAQLERMLQGGPKEMTRRERQEARADDHDPRVWAGATAPGASRSRAS